MLDHVYSVILHVPHVLEYQAILAFPAAVIVHLLLLTAVHVLMDSMMLLVYALPAISIAKHVAKHQIIVHLVPLAVS